MTAAEIVAGRTSKTKPWLFGVAASIAAMMSFPQKARPTSCISGPFIVFFDWDKDEITEHFQDILDIVVASRGLCGAEGPLSITGHADRSGSGPYNLSLSQRRAERVRAYLSRHGFPDEEMTAQAHGESRPLVQTPDGVQELQNRRVELLFRPWGS